MASPQTLSEENYLKNIYNIGSRSSEKISPTAIAEALNNNPASVVDMLKKLVDKQLIVYDKTRGVRLTETGTQTAVLIVRKHRLWEVFLYDKLGYTWDEIHDIAEQLEHVHHPNLADRLDQFLDFPEYDPHGDPIPKANGEMATASTLRLSELKPGQTANVTGVKDTSVAFLQYLAQLKVGIGTAVSVIGNIPYDGSMVVQFAGEPAVTVSQKFTENVVVKSV